MTAPQPGGSATNAAEQWLDGVDVDPAVRALRPDYTAMLVVADGLQPGPSDETSDALLTAAEAEARRVLAGRAPHELEQVSQWRDAYRAFGAKPQRTRPSVEALLRRVEAGLPRIDRLTDAYNAVSLTHLLPIGGEDLNAYRGCARLTRATGTEPFDTSSEGAPVIEHPEPGEVVWSDDAGVTCRRWNWRQCTRTRITDGTTRAVFILDGLSVVGRSGVEAAAAQLVDHLTALNPVAGFSVRLIDAPPEQDGAP